MFIMPSDEHFPPGTVGFRLIPARTPENLHSKSDFCYSFGVHPETHMNITTPPPFASDKLPKPVLWNPRFTVTTTNEEAADVKFAQEPPSWIPHTSILTGGKSYCHQRQTG
jgi:hypothetical protein